MSNEAQPCSCRADWWALPLAMALTAVAWLWLFPVTGDGPDSRGFFDGVCLITGAVAYYLVLRLGVKVLAIGWAVFVYGILLGFLAGLTEAPDTLGVFAAGLLKASGLALVAVGIYGSQKRLGNELTKARQAEDALAESEQRYRAIVEDQTELICRFRPDGVLTFVNDAYCRYFDKKREELIGHSFMPLIPEDDHETLDGHLASLDRHHPVGTVEHRVVKPDGTIGWQQWTNRMISDDERQTVEFQSVGRDITKRKLAEEEHERLEEQAQQTQKLESLGVLAGGIAHDFNNLLTAVLGNASLALRDLSSESATRESLEQIELAARDATRLTSQMLAYSGKGKFLAFPLDLSRLIGDMQPLIRASVSDKADLHYGFAPDLPPIEADVAQIQQAILDLITNASEALGDADGRVAVTTRFVEADRAYLADTYLADDLPEGHYVCLTVADTGCGMDEATMAKIFDPFFGTKFVGRGLGLAAVLGIVRGHSGAVKVESEPGRGATFTVLFPPSEKPVETAQKTPREDVWRGRGTVLLVDDEPQVRDVAEQMLEVIGFSVLTAKDGREGVEVFRQRSGEIAAVLLDLTMPHMDGVQAFEEMCRIRSEAPVLLSSGYAEDEARNRFAENGLAGFIQKPYATEDLRQKLHAVLGQ